MNLIAKAKHILQDYQISDVPGEYVVSKVEDGVTKTLSYSPKGTKLTLTKYFKTPIHGFFRCLTLPLELKPSSKYKWVLQ